MAERRGLGDRYWSKYWALCASVFPKGGAARQSDRRGTCPETFELLAANAALLSTGNITLLNIAASDQTALQGFTIPQFKIGLKNYYQAHLAEGDGECAVLCLPIDSLNVPHRITLVKIDPEGHDYHVLKGMEKLLERDRPVLIVESGSSEVVSLLTELGYSCEKNPGSPNLIFQHPGMPERGHPL